MDGIKKTIIVNLFAGPGAGKTTTMAGLFSKLKLKNINCEMVTEFAKELTWEERKIALSNSIYIFGEQQYRLFKLNNKVDIIVTDCPLLISYYFNKKYNFNDNINLDNLILSEFQKYYNINVFVNRVKPFNPKGRNQNEEESIQISKEIKLMLEDLNIPFITVDGNAKGIEDLYDIVLSKYMEIYSKG